MKAQDPSRNRKKHEVELLLHAINNLLCSIRFHADALSTHEEVGGQATDILNASRQLKTDIDKLASLARRSLLRRGDSNKPDFPPR